MNSNQSNNESTIEITGFESKVRVQGDKKYIREFVLATVYAEDGVKKFNPFNQVRTAPRATTGATDLFNRWQAVFAKTPFYRLEDLEKLYPENRLTSFTQEEKNILAEAKQHWFKSLNPLSLIKYKIPEVSNFTLEKVAKKYVDFSFTHFHFEESNQYLSVIAALWRNLMMVQGIRIDGDKIAGYIFDKGLLVHGNVTTKNEDGSYQVTELASQEQIMKTRAACNSYLKSNNII